MSDLFKLHNQYGTYLFTQYPLVSGPARRGVGGTLFSRLFWKTCNGRGPRPALAIPRSGWMPGVTSSMPDLCRKHGKPG